MEFVTKTVPKDFNIFFLGDIHIGSELMHEKGLDSFVDAVQHPYAGAKTNVIIGMGDYIEAIDNKDKRFDVSTIDKGKMLPMMQIEYFIEKLRPVAKKIAVLLNGNHENSITSFDLVQWASRELNTTYGTYTSVVSFIRGDGEPVLKCFATHGRRSIGSTADSPERQNANMLLQLKRLLWRKSGDCAIMAMGHTHKLLVAPPERTLYLTSDCNDVQQHYTSAPQHADFIPKDLRWYINTGSLLRLYKRGVSGYAECGCYDPVELGYAVARVRNGIIVGVDRVIV